MEADRRGLRVQRDELLMDSTVIQEIANQLGIAVDKTGEFIAEQIPVYAQMKAFFATSWVIGFAVAFLIAIAAIIICTNAIVKEDKKSYMDKNDTVFIVSLACLIAGLFLLIVAIVGLLLEIPEAIGWSNYPEAMLLDMAMKAVG